MLYELLGQRQGCLHKCEHPVHDDTRSIDIWSAWWIQSLSSHLRRKRVSLPKSVSHSLINYWTSEISSYVIPSPGYWPIYEFLTRHDIQQGLAISNSKNAFRH